MQDSPLMAQWRLEFERARREDNRFHNLDRDEYGQYVEIHTWVAWKYFVKGKESSFTWMPIDSAPQDGTEFIGLLDGRIGDCYKVQRDDCEMWYFRGTTAAVDVHHEVKVKPTHYLPMPGFKQR